MKHLSILISVFAALFLVSGIFGNEAYGQWVGGGFTMSYGSYDDPSSYSSSYYFPAPQVMFDVAKSAIGSSSSGSSDYSKCYSCSNTDYDAEWESLTTKKT